jgi:hypothetical protein
MFCKNPAKLNYNAFWQIYIERCAISSPSIKEKTKLYQLGIPDLQQRHLPDHRSFFPLSIAERAAKIKLLIMPL